MNELGYPSRGELRKWGYEFNRNGDIKKESTRCLKFKLNELLTFIRILKSNYCYHKGNLADQINILIRALKLLISAVKFIYHQLLIYFDGAVVSWTINTSPNAELVNGMLDEAIQSLRGNEKSIIHIDRGAHYRWSDWIDKMESNELSEKGCSLDIAACEGFFGRLKNEFFYGEPWNGVSIESFIEQLDEYLVWYNNERIKLSLGGMSMVEHRKMMNLTS